MIIKKLTICNFKNYIDSNTFDWHVDGDKNVILIGGMNGSGKTTISEAIKLCLYGNKMQNPPLSDSGYQVYLNEIWNKSRHNDDMSILMDVEKESETGKETLTITRYFKKIKNKITEKLSLTKNGRDVELIDREYWGYYVSKIVPSHLSRYFFFDGEVVKDTISSNKSSEYLLEAIKDLTGVSKLETLKCDLLEVKKRISRTNIKPGIEKKIKRMENELNSLETNIEELKNKINRLNEEKEQMNAEKINLDDELNRALGTSEKAISKINKEIETKEKIVSELNEQVHNFAYSSLPKLICNNLMKETIDAAKQENDENFSSINKEYILEHTKKLKNSINELLTDSKLKKNIAKIIDEEFSSSKNDKISMPVIDLSYNQINILDQETFDYGTFDDFIKAISERENNLISIGKLKRKLQNQKDDAAKEIVDQINIANGKINDIDLKLLENNALLKSKQTEYENKKDEIYNEEKALILNERDKNAVEIVENSIINIDVRVKIRLSDAITQLESDINEIYNSLKNKDDMVKQIQILPDYSLKLEGFDGREVYVKHISEGEKGILMYSVMYGLLNIAESKLPLIIDSPLGRMDSEHVEKLVTKLYPIFGNQVIILSHDREITSNSVPLIESVLSKKYLLKNKGSKINEGYFE